MFYLGMCSCHYFVVSATATQQQINNQTATNQSAGRKHATFCNVPILVLEARPPL